MYIINLFGVGIRYQYSAIPIELYNKLKDQCVKQNDALENILQDITALTKLGYKHWTKLNPIVSGRGLILEEYNTIEIKNGAKRITRFSVADLLNESFLLPLYQSKILPQIVPDIGDDKLFLILEFDKGLIGKFEIDEDDLDINQLVFEVKKYELDNQSLLWLDEIRYEGRLLHLMRDDSVQIRFRVYEIA